MRILMRRPELQMFTPDCYAAMLGNEGARIAQRLNAWSLSVAIVHASELIDRKIKSDRRVFSLFPDGHRRLTHLNGGRVDRE